MVSERELRNFETVLIDLKRTLLEEHQLLEHPDQTRFEVLTISKLQIFGKLNQFKGSGLISRLPDQLVQEIEEIDHLLRRNSKVLRLRIDALSEVSQTISRAIEEAQSDGTYNVAGRL